MKEIKEDHVSTSYHTLIMHKFDYIVRFRMSIVTFKQVAILKESCDKILREQKDIRFVGIINSNGNLIAGGFKKGVLPYVDKNQEHMMYMQQILDIKMRKEFDESLGRVQYVHSKRENINMISMPVGNHLIFLATEISVDIDKIFHMIKNEFLELQISDNNLEF